MRFTPLNNPEPTQVITNVISLKNLSNNKKDFDTNEEINPKVYRIIRKERRLKKINSIIWFTFLVLIALATTALLLTHLNIINSAQFGLTTIEKEKINYIGYYILFSILAITSIYFSIKNAIEFNSWKTIIKKLRNAYSINDATANFKFYDMYKKLILKGIKTTWIFIFILTFYGYFALLIFAFKYVKVNTESELITIKFNMELLLEKAFGDIKIFSIINVISLLIIAFLYVIIILIDKKRINDFQYFLGTKTIDIAEAITIQKQNLNKAFLKAYLVSVGIFIVLPIFLLLLSIYRKLKRRKK
ncbi:MSC_0882 family membrane protein [Mycoplasma crocodyli]|uniref:MSC_0882 family membrane protein n=1 Tax=Mycoplasma crocodyli TaxID=50052 RepID=UPI0002D46FAB|nr:hypothetical protein [Mycoplasma crocodyli]